MGIPGYAAGRRGGRPGRAGREGGGIRPPREDRRRCIAGHRGARGRVMTKAETEQLIERSPEDVWAYAADVVRHPEWMGVTDATLLDGNGSDVGSRGRERLVLGPFKWDAEFEVS